MKMNFDFTTQIERYLFKNLEFLNPHITLIEAEPRCLCQRVWLTINNLEFIVYMMGDNMRRIRNDEDVLRGKFKVIEALTPEGEQLLEQYKEQIYIEDKVN